VLLAWEYDATAVGGDLSREELDLVSN